VEIINAVELERATRRRPHVAPWLATWRVTAEGSGWKSLVDVRRTYPTADGVRLGKGRQVMIVTVFNAGGNDYRLLTRISYAKQIVQVEQVLTHAEYSKGKWKNRYA
jgi:mRNA interferase HigB